jgi:hypothetical protein
VIFLCIPSSPAGCAARATLRLLECYLNAWELY